MVIQQNFGKTAALTVIENTFLIIPTHFHKELYSLIMMFYLPKEINLKKKAII
jgi:hypothetical protein